VKHLSKPELLAALAAVSLLATPALGLPVEAQPQPMEARLFAERNSFVALAGSVTPGVVSIDVAKTDVRPAASLPFDDPMLRRFFGDDFPFPRAPQERVRSGKGSGVIISEDGVILTNHHVVSGADNITVTLHDGREFPATVVGVDPSTDVAVVKIEGGGKLPAARLGNSRDLPIGSWLMAVGNPHGLTETVTVGILSGKGRVIGAGLYDDFLQTDAAINPGNSGGGLFNSEGELVGINTAMAGQGIGFAIPIEMAQKVASDLQSHGKVQRGYLGVSIQELTPALRQALKLPPDSKGVLLNQILPEGPASKAGLQAGDVVLELNGQPVANQRALLGLVAQAEVGSTVSLKVWRHGRALTLSSPVAHRPDDQADVAQSRPSPTARTPDSKSWSTGFQGSTVSPEMARRMRLERSGGVLIEQVRPGTPAARAGLRPGDVITEVDGQPVATLEALHGVLEKAGPAVAVLLTRGDRQIFTALERS
jgi:serine protease Do